MTSDTQNTDTTRDQNSKNNKNVFRFISCFYFFFIMYSAGNAQPDNKLAEGLKSMGYENIRTMQSANTYYVAFENNVFRWTPSAIKAALNYISENIADSSEVKIVIVDNAIPQYTVEVNATRWKNFREGKISYSKMEKVLLVNREFTFSWEKLKNQPVLNPSVKKTDWVLFPTFAYENTRLSKIYEFQFNIAPVLEFSLWRGNLFTGQVIFPVHNELGYEGDFIRPGYITLSQNFRPLENWWSTLSVGNFSNSRYGIDFKLTHPFKNENWCFELNTGLTGSSHFYDNRWTHGPLKTFTGNVAVSWYYDQFNLVFKGGITQYIYGDKGLVTSITRFFGETAVGFYAQTNEHNFNAGVSMTIPFPVKRRKHRNFINFAIPEHLDFTYNAGTELFYGQYFRANPMLNQIKSIKFTSLIKENVLKPKQ